MSLQHIALQNLTPDDLSQLLANKVPENRHLDYKLSWSLVSDEEKREFLFDVASFANTVGGDLIYGVRAKDGVPIELAGLSGFNADREQLTVENLVRSAISPRLARLEFRAIQLETGNIIWIVRVSHGMSQPHMVRIGSWSKFYGRNSAGKYELDVHEIRRAFVASEGVLDKLKEFRVDRVHRVNIGDAGAAYYPGRKLVLHLLPVATISDPMRFSVAELHRVANQLRPFGHVSGWGSVTNIDGVSVQAVDRAYVRSGIQIFRNGAVEVVDAQSINVVEEFPSIIFGARMEMACREGFQQLLTCVSQMGLTPPFVLGMTLLGVKETVVTVRDLHRFQQLSKIDRDVLMLPATSIDDLPITSDQALRASFDMIWNACGYRGSPNYDSSGKWNVD